MNRNYQKAAPLPLLIEERNQLLVQLALTPPSKRKAQKKEKTLAQIIMETPPSELKAKLESMGISTNPTKEGT